ncbi:MAG: MOFRL family protein, partial [Acidobacteriota bacterium]
LVIALITGGASSMVLSPPPGAGPEDATGLNKILIDSGAEISEINCVRKHFSTLKGGQLAALIYPAEIFILALSDTISSSPADIGSGMFSPDPTSYRDAMDILERYRLIKKAGEKAIKHLEAGIRGDIPETPTPGAKIFKNNRFLIAGDNLTALNAGANMGAKLGFETRLLEQSDSGDTKKAAKKYAVMIKNIIKNRKPGQHPILILAGGELTVKVKGEGKGGRNQEFILTILKELKDIKHPFFISSIGTDGIDGPTDAAGAWINERTIKKIGKDPEIIITKYLKNNDSYNFFDKTGNLIRTGPTKTNVMDIRMFLIS